jgi:hypothetical protein
MYNLAVCCFCIVACYKYILTVIEKNYEKRKEKSFLTYARVLLLVAHLYEVHYRGADKSIARPTSPVYFFLW